MRLLLAEDDPLLGDGLRAGLPSGLWSTGCGTAGPPSASCARRPMRLQCWTLACPGSMAWRCWPAPAPPAAPCPMLVLTARDAVPTTSGAWMAVRMTTSSKPVDLFELGARLRAWCGARTGRRRSSWCGRTWCWTRRRGA